MPGRAEAQPQLGMQANAAALVSPRMPCVQLCCTNHFLNAPYSEHILISDDKDCKNIRYSIQYTGKDQDQDELIIY